MAGTSVVGSLSYARTPMTGLLESPLLAWREFFLAMVGATAALMGLLFVVLTISLRTITARENVAIRATARAIFTNYANVFTQSAIALYPLSLRTYGVIVLLLTLVLLIDGLLRTLRPSIREQGAGYTRREMAVRMGVGVVIAVPGFISMGAMIAGQSWGLYVFAPTTLFFVVFATLQVYELVFRAAAVEG